MTKYFKDIFLINKEIKDMRGNILLLIINIVQAVFELQNKNEEVNSYLRELTRMRQIDEVSRHNTAESYLQTGDSLC